MSKARVHTSSPGTLSQALTWLPAGSQCSDGVWRSWAGDHTWWTWPRVLIATRWCRLRVNLWPACPQNCYVALHLCGDKTVPRPPISGGLLPTALPAVRTVGLDNPKPQIVPNTRYVVFIAMVIFSKFGGETENKNALWAFVLSVLTSRSLCPLWVMGLPPPESFHSEPESEKGPRPRTQVYGRQVSGQTARVQVMGASLVSTGQGYPSCCGTRQGFLEEAATIGMARSSLRQGGGGRE